MIGATCQHPGCGLRIHDRWDGWHHANTAAGRAAQQDHRAQPPTFPRERKATG